MRKHKPTNTDVSVTHKLPVSRGMLIYFSGLFARSFACELMYQSWQEEKA